MVETKLKHGLIATFAFLRNHHDVEVIIICMLSNIASNFNFSSLINIPQISCSGNIHGYIFNSSEHQTFIQVLIILRILCAQLIPANWTGVKWLFDWNFCFVLEAQLNVSFRELQRTTFAVFEWTGELWIVLVWTKGWSGVAHAIIIEIAYLRWLNELYKLILFQIATCA